MKSTIFTLSRQYGSGGHEIGEKLAKKLDIPFYDNELIALAAQKSGVSKEIFEQVDEKPTNSFLYSLAMGSFNLGGLSGYTEMSINDKLFIAQSEVIEDAANKGSCVIVGRCANYVLRERSNCVNVFCYGDMEDRIKRVQALSGLPRQKAQDTISRKDKTAANFYNYYTNQKWSDPQNYDLLINTSRLSIDETVNLIIRYEQMREWAQK